VSLDYELAVTPTSTPRPKPEPGTATAAGRSLTDHAFSMRWTKRRSWRGLAIVDRDELPAVPLTSPALQHGQAVSDVLAAYRADDGSVSVFRPDSHLKRLNNAARRLALPQVDFDRAWYAIRHLVQLDADWLPAQPGSKLCLHALLAGSGSWLDPAPAEECLFTVLASPLVPAPPAGRAARAMVVDRHLRAWPGGLGDVNAVGNAGLGLVPREIAANYGYDHVLWVGGGPRPTVQQIGSLNVFLVIDGVLTTPALDGTLVPGITRDSIIKLARDEGEQVVERPLELAEVLAGISDGRITECFATGTVGGVVPIGDLGYQAEEYRLPEGTAVATRYRDLLAGVHSGAGVDRFGWMRRLTEVSTVHA
jgi:branched-chain amino acid aminotransferase